MTFTSNKSMEIEVLVDADPVVDNSQKRYRAASAFFTYVSLNQEGKPMPVPQLVVSALMVTSCPKQGRTQAWDQGLCSGIDSQVSRKQPCKLQTVPSLAPWDMIAQAAPSLAPWDSTVPRFLGLCIRAGEGGVLGTPQAPQGAPPES